MIANAKSTATIMLIRPSRETMAFPKYLPWGLRPVEDLQILLYGETSRSSNPPNCARLTEKLSDDRQILERNRERVSHLLSFIKYYRNNYWEPAPELKGTFL